jgi:hypothetical protein
MGMAWRVQSRCEPSASDVLNRLDELSLLTLVITYLLGARRSLVGGSVAKCCFCAGLLLQTMKTIDGLDAAAAPSIAVGVLIGLVHLFFIGYFLQQLLPELFTKISALYAP